MISCRKTESSVFQREVMFLRIFRRCGGRVSYSLPKNNSMLSRICLAVHPSVETEDAAWVSIGNGRESCRAMDWESAE